MDYLWIIVMFLSAVWTHSDGTHSLQSIYWWTNDVTKWWWINYVRNDVTKSLKFRKNGLGVSKWKKTFLVNYFLKTKDTHKTPRAFICSHFWAKLLLIKAAVGNVLNLPFIMILTNRNESGTMHRPRCVIILSHTHKHTQ